MLHSKLKERIAILARNVSTDKAGSAIEAWDLIANTWAEVKFRRDSIKQDDAIAKYYRHLWVKIRRPAFSIKRGMKVIFKSDNYYIQSMLVLHKDYIKFEIIKRV